MSVPALIPNHKHDNENKPTYEADDFLPDTGRKHLREAVSVPFSDGFKYF